MFSFMENIRYRGQVIRPLGCDPIAVLPDGSLAFLPIDQTPNIEFNRNNHGWPANNIQEYMNQENQQIRELMLQNMKLHQVSDTSMNGLTDAQKCSLTPSRRSQTMSEFMSEQSRLDSVRESYTSVSEEKKDDLNKIEFKSETE